MHYRIVSIFTCLVVCISAWADGWNQSIYDKVLAGIREPKFADRTFVITEYGASTTAAANVNQVAINKAITACSEQGGGRVVVPKGDWPTGAIRLRSHVNLVVEEGARLSFVYDTSLYPLVETSWEGLDLWNYSPLIYAFGETDVAITGRGVLDGMGSNDTWWQMSGAPRYGYSDTTLEAQSRGARARLLQMSDEGVALSERQFGQGHGLRPQFVCMNQCDGVLVEGVTVRNSPFWSLHPLKSGSVTVRGVKVENNGPNGDGLDPESCDGVLVEDCYFNTGDDCIAIKSGRNRDGRTRNMPSKNIIVRRCQMANGHGGVVIGSEISGGVSNVFVEDCDMDSPNLERVIRLKTNTCRGGVTDGVFVRNIRVGECREAVLKINLVYEPREQSERGHLPMVRNVYLENVNCNKSKYGAFIDGLTDSCNIHDVVARHCYWQGVTEGRNLLRGRMGDVRFEDVTINGKACTD